MLFCNLPFLANRFGLRGIQKKRKEKINPGRGVIGNFRVVALRHTDCFPVTAQPLVFHSILVFFSLA